MCSIYDSSGRCHGNACRINEVFVYVFSLPVRKYRKSYCSHPGVGVRVRVAQMLKFLIKVFISLYLLNMFMDQVDTLHVGRYWSEVLCSTIMTTLGDLEVKVTDLEIIYFVLKFLVKVFISLYLFNMLMDQVNILHVGRYWSEVLCCTIMTYPG